MASGPALDVKKAAGEEVELAAVRMGPIPLGDVVTTPAGALPFHSILHAAVTGQDLHPNPEAAGRAMGNAIRIAGEKRWKKLLIHSFLGGRKSGPEILRSAITTLVDSLLDGSSLQQVTLLAADEGERAILHEILLRTIQKEG